MIVGIDLGTTNSLIGRWTDTGAQLLPNVIGSMLTPSAVSLSDDGTVLVGQAARDRLITHPTTTAAAFKRYMGSNRETRLGKRTFRPEELSALVLRSLVADAEAATGDKVVEAVISVPAYFSDSQRKATRAAGELAGLRVERLINEPTAAAIAYGLTDRKTEGRFLVFDLGGGTFDVSILETFEGLVEVHASAGDNFLGGNDFDDLLLQEAARETGVSLRDLGAADVARLRAAIERAKCDLSGETEVRLSIRVAGTERPWSVDAERFEHLAAPLLQRMRAPIERALRDSRTPVDDLDEIVLVGGASRMPMVRRLATRMFGRLPLRHINPDEIVALGAATMAGMKQRAAAFREVVLTDVCPYTLGVEVSHVDQSRQVQDGLFSPLIERNTVVPTSRVQRYVPIADYQPKLVLRVFQGESPRTVSNILLGEIDIPLPRMRCDEVPVDVRFTYDVNGLLEVEATVVPTGATHQLVIQQGAYGLSAREIAERLHALSELKTHPRELQANVAFRARSHRLYEEHLGDTRRRIGEWLTEFEAAIETQDPQAIERVRARFARFLDDIEAGRTT